MNIQPIEPILQTKLRNAGLLAAVAVVMVHLRQACCEGTSWQIVRYFTGSGFCRFAVPFFFLVSGYLLAAHLNEIGWWKRESIKRIRSLAIPFFLWSLLFAAFCLTFKALPTVIQGHPFPYLEWFRSKGFTLLGLDPYEPPFLLPLWYIRQLFLLVLAAPLCVIALKQLPKTTLAILFIANFAWAVFADAGRSIVLSHRELSLFRWIVNPEAIFYFTLGLFLRTTDTSRFSFLNKIPTTLFLGLAFALLLIRYCLEPSLGWIISFTLVVPLAMLGFWRIVPSNPWPQWLTTCAFPIFLMHYFITHAIAQSLKNKFPIPSVTEALLTTLVAVILPIAITLLLRRYCPKITQRLFGGR